MKNETAINVQGLSKKYSIGTIKKYKKKEIGFRDNLLLPFRMLRNIGETSFFNKNDDFIWALKDINFKINHGEKVGIIGKNGAGKSTLLKILSRLVYPTEGKARIRGRVTSLLEVGTGFNNNFTGRENVYLNATLYGLERAEIDSMFDDIVEFSGVGKFLDTKIKYYSSGMRMRLAFSVAAHLDPDILLLDEVLAVGDIAFQQKCLKRVDGLASGGRTVVFVSHSMGAIVKFCDRVIWLDGGRIVESGDAKSVVAAYSKKMLNLQASYNAAAQKSPNDKNEITAVDNVNETEENEETPHPEALGAELISVEISSDSGDTKELFFRNEPITVTVKYRALRDDIQIYTVIHLYKDGIHVFTTHDDKNLEAQKNSVCTAMTSIPPNMLNTGDYSFSVAIVTPRRPKWRHVWLDQILSFKVVEGYDENRIFAGDYRGVVRPKFQWNCYSTNEKG